MALASDYTIFTFLDILDLPVKIPSGVSHLFWCSRLPRPKCFRARRCAQISCEAFCGQTDEVSVFEIRKFSKL